MPTEMNQIEARIKKGIEYRDLSLTAVEPQTDEEHEYIVEGYATTFDEPYLLYGDNEVRIYEIIDSHAFDNCDMTDVIMQYDHSGRVFARTRNNTLTLTPDAHGLHTRAVLGKTDIGKQLYQEIQGGYIDRMSFAFIVSDETREDRTENGVDILTRRITGISRLLDVSAVSMPANDGTEISARSYCDGLLAEVEAERRKLMDRRRLELKLKMLEVD